MLIFKGISPHAFIKLLPGILKDKAASAFTSAYVGGSATCAAAATKIYFPWRPYTALAAAAEGDWILLSGLRFFGRHGALPEETSLGQSFVVDVRLQVDTSRAGLSDQLRDTVNYAAVYGDIKAVVEGPPCQLLEAVANRAVAEVLRQHPDVRQVDFTIRKLSIPGVPSVVDSVGVQIRRGR